MDCSRFEQLLDEWVAQSSAGRLDPAARTHAQACARCRRLLSIANGELDLLGSGAATLTLAIVAHTTGAPCADAEVLAAARADRALTGEEAALLAAHVGHCPGCAKLDAALLWISAELPRMAEVTPDSAFVRDVLRATWMVDRRWPARVRLWWEHMVARPRFALEVGYSFALLLALLCGTPVSPLREAPGKVLATLQLRPLAAAEGVATSVDAVGGLLEGAGERAWDGTGGKLLGSADELRADFSGRRTSVAAGWKSLSGHVRDVTRGLLHADLNNAALALKAAGRDCGQIWKGLWKAPGPQPGANEADVNG